MTWVVPLQYVPDALRDEAVNIGVMALAKDGRSEVQIDAAAGRRHIVGWRPSTTTSFLAQQFAKMAQRAWTAKAELEPLRRYLRSVDTTIRIGPAIGIDGDVSLVVAASTWFKRLVGTPIRRELPRLPMRIAFDPLVKADRARLNVIVPLPDGRDFKADAVFLNGSISVVARRTIASQPAERVAGELLVRAKWLADRPPVGMRHARLRAVFRVKNPDTRRLLTESITPQFVDLGADVHLEEGIDDLVREATEHAEPWDDSVLAALG